MKPREFFYVVIGLIVVVAGAGAYGYSWGMKYIKTQSSEYAAQQAEQQVAEQQIDKLTLIGSSYQKEVVPVLSLMDQSLPRSKSQSEVLAQIERLASANGLTLASISMPAPTGLPSASSQTIAVGDVLALPINFNVSGTYDQLQSFTEQLENLNRFTNITTLTVTAITEGVQYTYNLNAYIKP